MLDYLGLGGPTPGTMPAAVPGAMGSAMAPPLPDFSAPLPPPPGGGGGAPPPLPPGAMPPGPPPGGLPPGAIPGMPSPFLPPGGAPMLPEYVTETQADGSILLYSKLPDGTKGPVVKIVNPIKPRQPMNGGQPGGAPPAY